MASSLFTFQSWLPEARRSVVVDVIAGLTLWAMIVPESVAYAMIAKAANPAAGLYMIIVALPVYALFASSRYLVATTTAAVSVTTAGFLGILTSQPDASLSALVLATAIAFLIFYFFRLGFLADFISRPVSRGFMIGLSIFIVVGQLPKLIGVEGGDGNTFQKLWALGQHFPQANPATAATGAAVLVVLVGIHYLSKRIPAGLVAIVLSVLACYAFKLGPQYGVDMVGALPSGLPTFVLPSVTFSDLGVLIPAAIGLVILATSEASVVADSLATEHGQSLDVNKQFFAFGMANLLSGFVGGLMSAGSTSSTMVNHAAGAKTLMSTIWAAAMTVLTLLFLTGVFAYVPEAFLGALIIHAVWHLLALQKIMSVRRFSYGEFYLALLALFGVLLFDVLYGLLIAMLLNVLYAAYRSSQVKVSEFGWLGQDNPQFVPLTLDGVKPLPSNSIGFGLTQGQIFYASARRTMRQARALVESHPGVKNVVVSVERLNRLDFTSDEQLREFANFVRDSGQKLFITNVRDQELMNQLKKADFDPDVVDVSVRLDPSKLEG